MTPSGPGFALLEVAEDHRRGRREVAADLQRREHAIDAVGPLGDVLEQEDAPLRDPEAAGGGAGVEQGQVAAEERALGDAGAQRGQAVEAALAAADLRGRGSARRGRGRRRGRAR